MQALLNSAWLTSVTPPHTPTPTHTRYELYLRQQWERREALVAMGNLSGMFKVRAAGN